MFYLLGLLDYDEYCENISNLSQRYNASVVTE